MHEPTHQTTPSMMHETRALLLVRVRMGESSGEPLDEEQDTRNERAIRARIGSVVAWPIAVARTGRHTYTVATPAASQREAEATAHAIHEALTAPLSPAVPTPPASVWVAVVWLNGAGPPPPGNAALDACLRTAIEHAEQSEEPVVVVTPSDC